MCVHACVRLCPCACVRAPACPLRRSVMSDSATPWTVARQAPLPTGFSRQEHWRGLPCPPPGDLPPPRDRTCISYVSYRGRWVLSHQAHLGSPRVSSQTAFCMSAPRHAITDSGPDTSSVDTRTASIARRMPAAALCPGSPTDGPSPDTPGQGVTWLPVPCAAVRRQPGKRTEPASAAELDAT